MARIARPIRMRAAVVILVVGLNAVVAGCGQDPSAAPRIPVCSPPAGGRCAADVPWSGPIQVSPDGRRLHGIVLCGGTLHATETSTRVDLTLHVGAVRAGAMSCARIDVATRLSQPLGSRTVVDAVSGRTIPVEH